MVTTRNRSEHAYQNSSCRGFLARFATGFSRTQAFDFFQSYQRRNPGLRPGSHFLQEVNRILRRFQAEVRIHPHRRRNLEFQFVDCRPECQRMSQDSHESAKDANLVEEPGSFPQNTLGFF